MIIYEHVWTIRMTRLLMSLMDATGEKSQMSLVVLQLDFYRLLPCRAATCVMHWQRKRSEFHPWCTPPEYQRNPFVALGPSSACTSHLWSMIHLSGPWSRRIWGRNLQPATPQIAARRWPPELNWNLYLWATWPHQNLNKKMERAMNQSSEWSTKMWFTVLRLSIHTLRQQWLITGA